MREVADRGRIEAFLSALAREATVETDVFLVGGTSAVLEGWRGSTIDIDLVMRPESDELLRAIPALKERLLRAWVNGGQVRILLPVGRRWSSIREHTGVVTSSSTPSCALTVFITHLASLAPARHRPAVLTPP